MNNRQKGISFQGVATFLSKNVHWTVIAMESKISGGSQKHLPIRHYLSLQDDNTYLNHDDKITLSVLLHPFSGNMYNYKTSMSHVFVKL